MTEQNNEGQKLETNKGQGEGTQQANYAEMDEVRKLVQSAEDKVRTKYVQQLKTLEEELKKLKPVEKTEAEKALETRIAELENRDQELKAKEWEMKVLSSLTAKGLHDVAPYFAVGSDSGNLEKHIVDFEKVINELVDQKVQEKLGHGYKPTKHKTQDDYNKAIADGDIKTALGFKLNKFFK